MQTDQKNGMERHSLTYLNLSWVGQHKLAYSNVSIRLREKA